MKKIILVMTLIIMAACSRLPERKEEGVKVVEEKKVRNFDEISPQNGIYYINGDQLASGEFVKYYEGEKLMAKANFRGGKYHGPFVAYYENGNRKLETNFTDGKRDGKYSVYYENGQVKTLENYENGLLQGEAVEYYETGEVESIINYKDDKPFGEASFYDIGGQLLDKIYYE